MNNNLKYYKMMIITIWYKNKYKNKNYMKLNYY